MPPKKRTTTTNETAAPKKATRKRRKIGRPKGSGVKKKKPGPKPRGYLKGYLSETERFAVQGMLAQNLSVEEMSEKLNRHPNTINKYIEEDINEEYLELSQRKTQEAQEKHIEAEKKRMGLTDQLVKQTFKDLVAAGMTNKDATSLINKVVESNMGGTKTFRDSKDLFASCIKKMRAGNFITKKTMGGNEGVAIMSGAASMRADESKKRLGHTRKGRGNVFNPSTGEIL